jgi:hypothetical protein
VQKSGIRRLVLHVGVERAKYNSLSAPVALGSRSINSVCVAKALEQVGTYGVTHKSLHWQQDIETNKRRTVTLGMSSHHECKGQITRTLKNFDKSIIKLRNTTSDLQSTAGSATGIRIRYLPISMFEC